MAHEHFIQFKPGVLSVTVSPDHPGVKEQAEAVLAAQKGLKHALTGEFSEVHRRFLAASIALEEAKMKVLKEANPSAIPGVVDYRTKRAFEGARGAQLKKMRADIAASKKAMDGSKTTDASPARRYVATRSTKTTVCLS